MDTCLGTNEMNEVSNVERRSTGCVDSYVV